MMEALTQTLLPTICVPMSAFRRFINLAVGTNPVVQACECGKQIWAHTKPTYSTRQASENEYMARTCGGQPIIIT